MINKQLLEKVADFNFWQKEQDTGIRRQELDKVLKFADDKNFALIVAGIRRAGKTYLCRQILQEKINQGLNPDQTLFVNFEDPILEPYLNTESLTDLYDTYRHTLNKDDFAYIVLDEIHNVPNWEKWVRIMLEKKENVKFILTGSSSKFYQNKQSEVLTGRSLTFALFPLSFTNFLEFKQYKPKKIESFQTINPLLDEYLEFGGFPLIVLEKDKDKKQAYLKALFDDIINKDIIIRHKLRALDVKKLAVVLINQFSSLVSVKRAGNFLKQMARTTISPTTINNYLEYFADSFLFLFVPIFSHKAKEVMQYPKKNYSIDTGLINALVLRFSDNIGRLYENKVANALWRRFEQDNVFYWRDKNHEVDFIVKTDKKVQQLIQVCYDLSDNKTKKRETSALVKASPELKCDDLLVITSDKEGQEKVEGKIIKYIPLWKWLLKDNESNTNL